jgi:hypothetical protein
MEWLGLGIAALLGFFVGAFLRGSASRNSQASELGRPGLNTASDRELALRTLPRDLANYMVRLDPDRCLRLYREARAADIAIGKADKTSQEAQLATITVKYPLYQDFDLIGTREHVLYADALSGGRLEDIEAHYLNMVKFHALQCVLNKDWVFRGTATSDRDLEHLEKYVQQIKDTKFRQRLTAAVEEFFANRRSNRFSDAQGAIACETDVLAVHYVPHFAENRYGFHFKDTDEFGLYGSFYDDSRDKTYQSFYRSNRKFEAEIYLNDLRIEEHI